MSPKGKGGDGILPCGSGERGVKEHLLGSLAFHSKEEVILSGPLMRGAFEGLGKVTIAWKNCRGEPD